MDLELTKKQRFVKSKPRVENCRGLGLGFSIFNQKPLFRFLDKKDNKTQLVFVKYNKNFYLILLCIKNPEKRQK